MDLFSRKKVEFNTNHAKVVIIKERIEWMKAFFAEFKKFIARGNVMDMAVGVIIGGAFTAIVTSLVDDVMMPLLSLITGRS